MLKKVFASLMIGAIAVISIPIASAFESRLINVSAEIGDVLKVSALELDFSTVFPQEMLEKQFTVTLSGNAVLEETKTQFATSVVSFKQGKRKNCTNVLADRSNPAKALGAPQSTGSLYDSPVIAGSYFSLGFACGINPAGSITLGFTNYIVNDPGADIKIYEVTGGPVYPDEKIKVEASQDNITYVLLTPSMARDGSVDLGILPWAKYVRITDVSDKTIFEDTADGYDLDGIRANSRTSVGAVAANYVVKQKPKCVLDVNPDIHPLINENIDGTYSCPVGSTMMPVLCPYLSKHEITTDGSGGENDSAGITAFHGMPLPWTQTTSLSTQQGGKLSVVTSDSSDTWNIDIKVPCFKGECAQDWATFVKENSDNPQINPELYKADPNDEGKIFGCDLWLEVTST